MTRVDLVFPSMGGEARVRLESVLHDQAELEALAAGIHSRIEAVEAVLSRFRPDSELSAFNRDPRTAVPASALLRRTVAAARWAAERSDGLVDATLLGELERAGYVDSFDPANRADSPRRSPPRPRAGRPRPRPGGFADRIGLDEEAASCARPASASIPAGSPRAWPPISRPRRSPRASATRSRAAATLPSAASSRGRSRSQRPQRGRGPPAARAYRRRRHVGDRRAHLAPRGRAYAHHVLDPATGRPRGPGSSR